MTGLLSVAGSTAVDSYSVGQSLLSEASGDKLKRVCNDTGGSTMLHTLSLWYKKGKTTESAKCLFMWRPETALGADAHAYFEVTNDVTASTYKMAGYDNSAFTWKWDPSNNLTRDYGAWVHYVIRCDATTSPYITVYENGQEISWATQTGNANAANWGIQSGDTIYIGSNHAAAPASGYIAEVNFIDRQSLPPTDFAEVDEVTGEYKVKEYTGTYTENSFYLKFDNTSSFGEDSSGLNNDMTTVSGFSANDQMQDSPTNNFCTINPLRECTAGAVITEGNLQWQEPGYTWNGTGGTLGASSGKWYFEFYCKTSTEHRVGAGTALIYQQTPGGDTHGRGYYGVNGNKYNNGNQGSYGSTFTAGDVIGVALDLENDSIYFAKNNTWQDSGDPTSGASQTGAAFTDLTSGIWFPQTGGSSVTQVLNTGSDSSFAGNKTAQGNQDGNSIGDFYYAPPSGFLAMCTSNLPTPEIADPTDHFNTILYDDGAGAKTGVGFQPDLVWVKSRGSTYDHKLTDAVRGVTKALVSNGAAGVAGVTTAETTDSTGLTAFGADGFTVGADTDYSDTTGTGMVSWSWKGDGVSGGTLNEDGTIDSQINVNTTAGFSIVSYTGTGSTGTIGHGLSSAPQMIIAKNRDSVDDWAVGSTEVGWTKYGVLNFSDAWTTSTDWWNDATPSASVFTVGNADETNELDAKYIAYCFHSIEGYSKLSTYTGNANNDGVFVDVGFRPAFLFLRDYPAADDFGIYDDKRVGYNPDNWLLYPAYDYAGSNSSTRQIDIVSNGFKLRTSNATFNPASTVLYYAVAKSPFKYARARG